MSMVKNLPTWWWEDSGEKLDKESIDEKLSIKERKIGEENQKIIKYKYCRWKNLSIWTKNSEGKPRLVKRRGTCLKRDLIKIRCCAVLQQSQTANGQIITVGFLTFPAPETQISGYLPDSGSKTAPTWIFPMLFHLARFLACLVSYFSFCFAGSWIIGLAIGGAESRSADVTIGFSR